MQTFTWLPRSEPQGRITQRVLTAKFGDGYTQRAADGIHNSTQSWPLLFVGSAEQIAPIKTFLDAHASWQSFLWTPPLGQPGAWRSQDGYQLTAKPGGNYELSVTFEEVHLP